MRSVIRPVQDIYNFFLNSNINDLLDQIHKTIMSNQNSRFKINFSFGYILKNIESDALRFFHPSYNNHCVLNTAKLISDSDELSRFLEPLSEFNFLENFERRDTKWWHLSTTNVTFYVNKLRKTLIGNSDSLPDFIVHNQGVHSLIADFRTGELYQDRLCIFRCLSLFCGFHLYNLETDTNEISFILPRPTDHPLQF